MTKLNTSVKEARCKSQPKADFSRVKISASGVISQNIDELLERDDMKAKLDYISESYFDNACRI